MKKKFLALVLTLAMVLSLVPVTALATEGTPTLDKDTGSVTTSQDGVNITKKVVPDGEGNYNLVMEAYVEGTTTETTTSTPLDIVLVLDVSGSMDDPMGNGDPTKRIDALKSAVNAFIDKVAEKNTDDIGHRISIVKFAGKKTAKVGNDTYRSGGYTYNYSQIVKNLTTVNDDGKGKLKTAVDSLQPAGATRADYGMQQAQTELNTNSTDSSREKVVVMFTDGSPNSSNGFDDEVASSAISVAKDLKDTGVKVYTIGIFNGANPSADVTTDASNENKYMHAVSSNYPNATLDLKHTGILDWEWQWDFGTRAEDEDSNYYLSATDADGLNKVFQEIYDSITNTDVTAGTSAVLRDTLTKQFVLNGTNADAVTVQKAEVKGKDGNAYTWKTPVDVTGIRKDISEDGKTVTVTGFDYTSPDNVITEKSGIYSGYKLIVTIPIKVNEAYEGWEAGTKNYDTNTTGDNNKAGLTGYTKGTDTNASTLLDRSPQVPVTAYTVKYDWGTSAPAVANIPTNSNTYLTGKTYPVDTTYATDKEIKDSDGGTWHFSGWTDPNNGVMGTNDVTITGSWKYTEPTPSAPTYTLTYDANGGKADSVPTDSNDYTAGQTVNLDYSKDAAHNQEGVIFIGWSETNDDGKIYNKGDTIPALIQSVTMNDNKTVYAVWGLDENGNNTPDVFEATVTYKIEHGHWYNAETGGSVSTAPVTAQFTLYEKNGNQWVAKNPTLGNTIPTGRGSDAGYTADGWYKDSKKIDISNTTPVTGDVTYTFKYVKTSTEATWDVSRSKTAASGLTKNSNGDWTTDVTLSLPSAEEKLASDVVFVLDKSTSATLEQQALNMLTKLKEQAEGTKAKVKVGVVIFNKQANVTPLTDLATGYNTIEQAIKQEIKKGTNTHAGLLAGKQMLDGDTEVSANRKYLIFVSDGISYMYDSDGKVVPYYWRSDTPYTSYDPYSWSFKYGDDNPPADWSAWVTQIGDIIKTENVTPILYAEHKAAVDNKTLDISQYTDVTDFATNQYTTCVDRALYYTYQTYTAAKNEGYNCYAVVNGSSTTYPWGPDFMNYLADGKTVNFDKIQNDILYAVSAGSTVIDTIGEKFTFGGVDSFTLKVGTEKIKGVKDASDANTVNFGEKSNGKYPYTVTYIPDTKTFAWTINEDVSNFAPVQLTYTVKLTKPETAAGTYGQTDLNGDTFIDGTQTKVDTGKALYTNQSATLLPVNSAGKPGQLLLFPMPSVSYTIKGSSGGHGGNGGGTVTIPDDVPTGLNGKDHYAYVVGYPDGMVYPQKNITRAEVATIFFRLLKDETREANMTKSNGYNDMKDGAWYTCAVSTLSKMGIIKGYEDGSFKPDASISRAEFAAIAARFDPDGDKTPATFSDVSSHWAKDEISIAANHGWIKGYEDGSFKPDQKITRAETMTLVNRVLKRLPETKDDLHKDMKTWPDNQNESAWFYLAVQEATNSHYQKLKKDGIHETWESMRETRDWAALEK